MTRKEMVAINNPEAINERNGGGVKGCPDEYHYLNLSDECVTKECEEFDCNDCWNKELEEEK